MNRLDAVNHVTVDTDWGVGIIQPSCIETSHIPIQEGWQYFNNNRKRLLDLISIEEFKKLFR